MSTEKNMREALRCREDSLQLVAGYTSTIYIDRTNRNYLIFWWI